MAQQTLEPGRSPSRTAVNGFLAAQACSAYESSCNHPTVNLALELFVGAVVIFFVAGTIWFRWGRRDRLGPVDKGLAATVGEKRLTSACNERTREHLVSENNARVVAPAACRRNRRTVTAIVNRPV
jgi:hypothetical protein